MKKFQLRFTNHFIHMIIRMMIILLIFGYFAPSSYSQTITAPNVSRCGEGDVTLTVTGSTGCSGGAFYWYDQPFYGISIGAGNTYTASALQENKTFYVDYVVAGVGICSRQPITAIISTSTVTANIFYPSDTYCNSLNASQTVTNTGSVNGVYTVNPTSPLVINSATGTFNPHDVTPGNYTITYTIPAGLQPVGCDEAPASVVITIAAELATPVISTITSPLCSTAAPFTVALTSGLTGGTYSASPSGLSITNGGYIDPGASLGGIYTITYTKSATGGCLSVSDTESLTINSASIGGTATAAYSPISAGTGTAISLSGYNGAIQWQQSENGGDGWATVGGGSGGTTSAYTTPVLSATTYYRAIVTNGICSPSTSATATVVVNAVSVAGTAGTAQNICHGFTADLTLTGNTGSIQWQTNATGSFVDINGATSASYSTPALTVSTSFRVVVTNGVSTPATSNEVLITVIPTSVGGSLNSITICSGSTTDLVLSENVGTIQWQTNASGSWADIGSATGAEYTTPALTVTTSYKAIVTSTPCSSVESSVAVVTVDPTSAGGTATPNPSAICTGGATTITLSGYTGTIQWQTKASGSFADIKGETASTYTTPALTATTSYRAVVTSGTCSSGNSTEAAVTVNPDPTLSQPGDVSICIGGTTTLTTSVTAGGTGTYSYQWQYSTTSDGTYNNVADATPTGISYSGNTSASLVITGGGTETAQANYYKCVLATNTPTGAGCDKITAAITVTTVADPTISGQPASTTECFEGVAQLTVTAANGTGGYSYQWYSNTVNNNTTGTLIESATASTYTPPATAAGTLYYYVIVSAAGNGCNNVTSDVAAVIVRANFTSGAILTTNEAICYSDDPAVIGSSSGSSGGDGTITYKWESSLDGFSTAGSVIVGATSASYDPPTGLTATTSYRRYAHDGTCNTSFVVSNGTWLVTVNPTLTASVSIAAVPSGAVCTGTSVTFTATPTNGGTPTYKWKKNDSNTGQTGLTYTYTPQNGEIIKVVMTSTAGPCLFGSPATSNEITMTVNSIPVAPTASVHTPSETQIAWNWTAVTGATGYKWNVVNTYGSATDLGDVLTKTETTLTCNTSYTRYIWAYNSTGCVSSVTTLNQATSSCSDLIYSTLSTSRVTYSAASANDLVKITSAEYIAVKSALSASAVGYSGTIDNNWATTSSGPGTTFSYNANSNDNTIPVFSALYYPVAFTFHPALNPQGAYTCQLKYNNASTITNISNIYSGATLAVQDRQYFVIKTPTQLPDVSTYISLFTSSGVGTVNEANPSHWDYVIGNQTGVQTFTAQEGANTQVSSIQVLQTATKQWP